LEKVVGRFNPDTAPGSQAIPVWLFWVPGVTSWRQPVTFLNGIVIDVRELNW
jgi:hypothetical protein